MLLVLLAVLPGLVLAAYTNLEQRRSGRSRVEKDASKVAQLAAGNQLILIESTREHLTALSRFPQARGNDLVAFDTFFGNMPRIYTNYLDFGLIETNGDLVACSFPRRGVTNLAHRADFRRVLETHQFAIGEYQPGDGANKPSLPFGHPIFNETGGLARVVYAALNLEILNQAAAKAQIPEGGVINIFDRGGHILARFPEPEEWVGPTAVESSLMATILSQKEGTAQAPGLDGVERLYAFTPIDAGQDASVFVSVGIPSALAFGEATRSMVRNLIILGAVALLALLGAWGYANSYILQPARALMGAASRLAAGDLSARAGSVQATGEFRELTRTFDEMAVSIQRQRTEIESSERTFRESEERIRLIIETALDAVVTIDSTGVITGWSPQAEVTFGWTRQEALGRLLGETIIPERYREGHARGMRRFLTTGEAVMLNKRVELTAIHHDGREFPVEISITPLQIGDTVAFNAFVRDITGRKEAEGKLQAQLERLNLLHQITRATGERQDLSSIYQVVIRSLEDQLPLDFGCLCLHDGQRDSLTVACVGSKSQPLAMELSMPEQAHVDIDQNGLLRCVQGQLVYEPDINEVKFPFPQRLATVGLRSVVFTPLRAQSNVFGVLVTARREAQAFSSGDCEFLRQLSEHVALAVHQAHLHGALQRAYDDLRQTQQAVMQQERLRALGQMASGVAHDINNAISPIALYTQALLGHEPNLSPRARDYLQIIDRAIDDVAATVSRMGEFYRQREPQLTLTRVHLNDLGQQAINLTRARWSDMPQHRGVVIEMQTEFAPDLPAVMGVESEIREALTNLILNAVDAMPEGGTLKLRTSATGDPSDTAKIAAARQVVVEVTDTGLGMDEETKRRCLEPFFTTKGERGTGLGLAMVYGVLQRHGADFEVESTVGKGTTVRLSFPMPSAVADEPAKPETQFAIPSRMRILVVDDDPMVLKSLRDTLETDGHVVVTANGGQEGMEAFRNGQGSAEPFVVVITDLGMPYVDGRKVASFVKGVSPTTPVILLTGWGQRLVAESDVPPHVDQVLGKPPKLCELREALARSCSSGSSREGAI